MKNPTQAFTLFKILLLLILGGCTNFATSPRVDNIEEGSGTTTSTSVDFTIENVTFNNNTFIVFFNTQQQQRISDHCQTSGNTCAVQLNWKEPNLTGGVASIIIIDREVTFPVTGVQPTNVSAVAPAIVEAEIPNGTGINVKVIPTGNNSSQFTMDSFLFTKGGQVLGGDITTEDGTQLFDILRYSCYRKRDYSQIKSREVTITQDNPSTTTTALTATQFCARPFTDGLTGCGNAPATEESSQQYPVNLYVTSDVGQFNSSNNVFVCAQTRNTLRPPVPLAAQPFPMDASFSLSRTGSVNFPVPIRAPSVLGNLNDPNSGETQCPTAGQPNEDPTPGDPNSISRRCLGFAMKPNSDGTCPSFRDASGALTPTYRLRRYVTIYPNLYNSTGSIANEPLSLDEVYVLDRPVQSTQANPDKPFTMRGPLPCNFSFFDHSGVTGGFSGGTSPALYNTPNGGTPRYLGTNHSAWSGTNVDGVHFPNQDSFAERSCSAIMPLSKKNAANNFETLALGTTHPSNNATISLGGGRTLAMNKMYVRPIEAFAPFYAEDTTVEACAPRAKNFIDPPLHFAKRPDGNISWCAEVYLTQNSAVLQLDPKQPGNAPSLGFVKGFTSHVAKNYTASGTNPTSCTATPPLNPMLPIADYPANPGGACTINSSLEIAGVAHHPGGLRVDKSSPTTALCANQTCDRTAADLGTPSLDSFKAPLLAEPSDVEEMLRNSSPHICAITYDNNGGKEGRSPASGCCLEFQTNNTNLTTGISSLPATDERNTAHVEPADACSAPNY